MRRMKVLGQRSLEEEIMAEMETSDEEKPAVRTSPRPRNCNEGPLKLEKTMLTADHRNVQNGRKYH